MRKFLQFLTNNSAEKYAESGRFVGEYSEYDLASLVDRLGVFDQNWYRERHTVPAEGLQAALDHYRSESAKADIATHPLFDTAWYRAENGDRIKPDISLLEHYVLEGRFEGKSPNPLFDPHWYIRRSHDKPVPIEMAFAHYVHGGALAGFSPHPLFDVDYYLNSKPSVRERRLNPLVDFLFDGGFQGKNPNKFFDSAWYLSTYPAVRIAETNPLAHFIVEGAAQGCNPHPGVDIDTYILDHDDVPRDRLAAFQHLVTVGANRLKVDTIDSRSQRRTVEITDASAAWDCRTFATLLTPDDRAPSILTGQTDGPDWPLSEETKLVSLDVWDTILRRDCDPDEIKLQSARCLLLVGQDHLRPAYQDVRALYKARIQAELASVNRTASEFRFEDMLARWFSAVLVNGVSGATIERIKRHLLEHELRSETSSTRLDEPAFRATKALGVPSIFSSDFYMPAQFLTQLLADKAVAWNFVKGFTSCDIMATKRDGGMFDYILQQFGLGADELVHIGDNLDADVTIPQSKGIVAQQYLVEAEEDRKRWFAAGFAAWLQGDNSHHERRLAALIEDVAAGLGSDLLAAIGARLAPIAVGFGLDILEDAVRSGIENVHFFAREGIFFQQVHSLICEADPFNLGVYPSASVLYVSRQATFAASLKSCKPSDLMRLWSLYGEQSLGSLAMSLNLDLSLVERICRRHEIDFTEKFDRPWKHAGVVNLLSDPEFITHAKASISRQREALADYLAQEGFTAAAGQAMIVDIGWRGSIQDNIALLNENTFLKGAYLGLNRYVNAQPRNASKSGWLFDENADRSSPIAHVAPLEMIFNGPGGSVTGYKREGDRIEPVREVIAAEEAVVRGEVARLQAGIVAAARPILDYIRLHGLTSAALLSMATRLAKQLIQTPPESIANTFTRLHHNETFGVGAVHRFDDLDEVVESISTLAPSEVHARLQAIAKKHSWPQAAFCGSGLTQLRQTATPRQLLSVPLAYARATAPAAVHALGSRLTIYAPSPIRASGGHRTIFNVANRLASYGFDVTVKIEDRGDGINVVEGYIGDGRVSLELGWNTSGTCDVVIASIAHSAPLVASLHVKGCKGYLVQDFEAAFNPMGDGYLAGEASYTLGLTHFTVGNWLSHMLNVDIGATAFPSGLGIDPTVYKLSNTVNRDPMAVCFLYQPDKPRRASRLGIAALRIVKQRLPDTRVIVYGSDLPIDLDFEHENLGLVTDLKDLNTLYGSCGVGLCISGSNPSRIPYEMMASGCVPVDLYRYNNLLDHKQDAILLAYQNAESIAAALETLLTGIDQQTEMRKAAVAYMTGRSIDWECDSIVNSVLTSIDDPTIGCFRPDLIYARPPVISANGYTKSIEAFCNNELQRARRWRA